MGEQVSSISPPSKPRPVPKFIFTDKNSVIDAYNSFTKEGFERQSKDERPYDLQKQFLSKVDVSKGPIQVRVESIVRTMVLDPDSIKGEKKEYLTYTSQWLAKDWLGNIIRCALEHEGKYMQQTKNTVTKFNPETGEEIVQYMKGVPREMFTIL